ncbi:hypothetical protein [Nostoc sp. ChiQUE02]|uniref:hypothetical protein n=1 Tax=Nostoc sp. ChiQUE02 TaxID=3075377 RepID=UPI003D1619B1
MKSTKSGLNLTCLLIAAQPNTRSLASQDQAEIKILLSLKLDWGIGHKEFRPQLQQFAF